MGRNHPRLYYPRAQAAQPCSTRLRAPPPGKVVARDSGRRSVIDFGLDTHTKDTWSVLEVRGEVDAHTAPRVRDRLRELVDDGHVRIAIDAEAVEFMDSTGLAVLVGALKRGREPIRSASRGRGGTGRTSWRTSTTTSPPAAGRAVRPFSLRAFRRWDSTSFEDSSRTHGSVHGRTGCGRWDSRSRCPRGPAELSPGGGPRSSTLLTAGPRRGLRGGRPTFGVGDRPPGAGWVVETHLDALFGTTLL